MESMPKRHSTDYYSHAKNDRFHAIAFLASRVDTDY